MLKIFIGYIFVFFDINIFGFDILANFIGYILIYMGLCKFSNVVSFKKAKPWVIVMTVVSLIESICKLLGYDSVILFLMIFILVSLYIMYLIDIGIREIEQDTGIDLYSQALLFILKFQAIFTIGSTLLLVFGFDETLTLVFSVLAVIANIIFFVYLYKAKKVLDANAYDG